MPKNNMKLSFIELLVFSSLAIVFAISGFIISEIINHYRDMIWGPNYPVNYSIEVQSITDCGVLAGIAAAAWIFYIYISWKNGIKEKKT